MIEESRDTGHLITEETGEEDLLTPVEGRAPAWESPLPWTPDEPRTLVIACSDGRIQSHLDAFVREELGVANDDRLYVPGGPGGLCSGSWEFARSDQFRKEASFLITAHGIEEVVFIFHGSALGGPEAAVCGDYRRKYARLSPEELNRRQEADLAEILRSALPWRKQVRIRAFRAEVTPEKRMRFVPLDVR